MELRETAMMMRNSDYRVRMKAEYYQTKIRYEKLKSLNTKIEAAHSTSHLEESRRVQMPKHDCPEHILQEQQNIMGQYLHILEVRAIIEGIDLHSPQEESDEDCGKERPNSEK